MNEIIFMLGDWPVRTIDAAIGFGALVLILLVTIAVVIARSTSSSTARTEPACRCFHNGVPFSYTSP